MPGAQVGHGVGGAQLLVAGAGDGEFVVGVACFQAGFEMVELALGQLLDPARRRLRIR